MEDWKDMKEQTKAEVETSSTENTLGKKDLYGPEKNEIDQEANVRAKHIESIQEKIANAIKNVDAMKIRNVQVGQTRLHRSKSVTITENDSHDGWKCEESFQEDGMILYVAIKFKNDEDGEGDDLFSGQADKLEEHKELEIETSGFIAKCGDAATEEEGDDIFSRGDDKVEEHKAQEIETTGFIANCGDTENEEELDVIEEEGERDKTNGKELDKGRGRNT